VARWITLEGGEGTGKSTQARLLASRIDAVLTREPGGTVVGERLRAVLLDPTVMGLDERAEALMMAADRAQHVSERVRPALESGRDVVSDRSAFSSLAYQGHGRGLGVGAIRALCDWATRGLWPDLAILLDVPADIAAARMTDAPDRLEAAGSDFHRRVAAGFTELAATEPDRWAVVDGTGSVADVALRVLTAYEGWVLDRD
jgi:dTMP kinase